MQQGRLIKGVIFVIVIRPEIMGKRRIDYKNKDGRDICGTEYHFQYESDQVSGLCCANCFISDKEAGGAVFEIGDVFTLALDPFNNKKRFSFLPL